MKRKDRVKETIRILELLPVIEGMIKEFEKEGLFKYPKRKIRKQGLQEKRS